MQSDTQVSQGRGPSSEPKVTIMVCFTAWGPSSEPSNGLFHSLRPTSGHNVSESALSAGMTKSHQATGSNIIIIDNFCIALFSGVPKLAALIQHYPTFFKFHKHNTCNYKHQYLQFTALHRRPMEPLTAARQKIGGSVAVNTVLQTKRLACQQTQLTKYSLIIWQ